MNRDQMIAWLTLEGWELMRCGNCYYVGIYGNTFARFLNRPVGEDTWENLDCDFNDLSGDDANSSEIGTPYIRQLYNTLVDYKENPT